MTCSLHLPSGQLVIGSNLDHLIPSGHRSAIGVLVDDNVKAGIFQKLSGNITLKPVYRSQPGESQELPNADQDEVLRGIVSNEISTVSAIDFGLFMEYSSKRGLSVEEADALLRRAGAVIMQIPPGIYTATNFGKDELDSDCSFEVKLVRLKS